MSDELLAGGATDKSYVTSVPDVDPTVILVGLPSSSSTKTGALKIFLNIFAWFPVYVKKFVQSTIVLPKKSDVTILGIESALATLSTINFSVLPVAVLGLRTCTISVLGIWSTSILTTEPTSFVKKPASLSVIV